MPANEVQAMTSVEQIVSFYVPFSSDKDKSANSQLSSYGTKVNIPLEWNSHLYQNLYGTLGQKRGSFMLTHELVSALFHRTARGATKYLRLGIHRSPVKSSTDKRQKLKKSFACQRTQRK